MIKDMDSKYRPESKWLGRNLANYKDQNSELARQKGKYDALMSAQTLTAARKIIAGKNPAKGN